MLNPRYYSRGRSVADKDELDIPAKPEQPRFRAPKPPLSFAGLSVEAKPQPVAAAAAVPTSLADPPAAKIAAVTPTGSTTAVEAGMLMVGPQVSFIGEINACKRLVVEGSID